MSEQRPGSAAGADAEITDTGPAPAGSAADTGQAPAGSAAAVVADLHGQLAQAQDQRLRALAEVENVRKRCTAQVGRAEAEAKARVAAQWLPVVDNLERALEHADGAGDALAQGIRAVRDQALGILAALGFPRRDDTGARFDPTRHEAIATRPDPGVPAGTVIEVTRPGYGESDHLLRPAQVVVAGPD
jgi:molecular chaperone GrpE